MCRLNLLTLHISTAHTYCHTSEVHSRKMLEYNLVSHLVPSLISVLNAAHYRCHLCSVGSLSTLTHQRRDRPCTFCCNPIARVSIIFETLFHFLRQSACKSYKERKSRLAGFLKVTLVAPRLSLVGGSGKSDAAHSSALCPVCNGFK